MFGYRKYNIFFIVTAIFFISMDVAVLINQLPLAPWLSLLLVIFFSIFLFIRGKSEGFPIIAATTIAPFLFSFVIILYRIELLNFIRTIPTNLPTNSSIYLFLLLCILIAIFLVVVLNHDIRFDKKIDRDYYIRFPGINKAISIIKVWMKYFVISIVVTFILSWIWNRIDLLPANAIFPDFNFSNFKFNQLRTIDWFWRTATLFVVVVFIIDIIRNLRSPLWDFFISYKSQNVDIARAIANRLIGSGLRVWFAEYQILLAGRARFQKAINKGIRQSRSGIALTNDDYAKSEYCNLEMDQLIRYCGSKNILEIKIPDEPLTHQKYSPLSRASQFVYRGDLENCFSYIEQETGWWIIPALKLDPIVKKETFEGVCLGQPYQLDTSGWELVEQSFHGGGPCYRRCIEGFYIYWNLQYGEEYSSEVYESRGNLSQKNDRQLYNMLIDYANHYFRDLQSESKVHGAHLFFLNHFSHFAVTYLMKGFWKRRYSIMLIHPVTSKAAEFLFTFEANCGFRNFCRASHIMDDLVSSLTWGNPVNKNSMNPTMIANQPSFNQEQPNFSPNDQAIAEKLLEEGLSYGKGFEIEAIKTWDKALNYLIDNKLRSQLLYLQGVWYDEIGETEKAVDLFQKSTKLDLLQYKAFTNLGSIFIDKGDYEKARYNLLTAIKINPEDIFAVKNLVRYYEYMGDDGEASYWRNRFVQLSNES